MKIKWETNMGKPSIMGVEEFLAQHDIEVMIGECVKTLRDRSDMFYASIMWEIKEGPILTGCVGFGMTPDKALADLTSRISGQLIVQHISEPRREIQVPVLDHHKTPLVPPA